MTVPFDWQRILLDNFDLLFLGEVAMRTLFSFGVVFLFLRISGRRGIRQLSLFEVLIILTLGSAAGDVAFYEDVPLLPIATVFVTLLVLYRLSVWFMGLFPRFGALLEGQPILIIRDGLYELRNLDRMNISSDEFFMELRQQGVEHLGQVRLGILEIDGNVSLFFFDSADVRPGLPVLPPELSVQYDTVPASGIYACTHCGFPQPLDSGGQAACPRCSNITWAKAPNHPRAR
ncbi:DUF421 domain-containing protein [Stutzerimonas azotifigens]|uniref:DUF421 domain-containing protein n=1 Tax=Stutzerimonas azotifigens TaxID=291995 RepID=UPI0004239A35|nr:DUF421 domain-containing protein [Stutzerimonas azotifigens]